MAHCPSLAGVYGLGSTYRRAMADFAEAAAVLRDHLAEIGGRLPKRVAVRLEPASVSHRHLRRRISRSLSAMACTWRTAATAVRACA